MLLLWRHTWHARASAAVVAHDARVLETLLLLWLYTWHAMESCCCGVLETLVVPLYTTFLIWQPSSYGNTFLIWQAHEAATKTTLELHAKKSALRLAVVQVLLLC